MSFPSRQRGRKLLLSIASNAANGQKLDLLIMGGAVTKAERSEPKIIPSRPYNVTFDEELLGAVADFIVP